MLSLVKFPAPTTPGEKSARDVLSLTSQNDAA